LFLPRQELGGATISADLKKVAYIAETKKNKNSPFFKSVAIGGKLSESPTSDHGKEYAYKDEFGEQLEGKSAPVIAELDLVNYELCIRGGISDGWAPGQLQYAGNE
jgi:hypothetical protein